MSLPIFALMMKRLNTDTSMNFLTQPPFDEVDDKILKKLDCADFVDDNGLEKFFNSFRNSELSDGRFSVHYPMIPMREFLEDPRILVGHESSAFQSVGNGGASGGPIGR